MTTVLDRWGNSLAVRLPKGVVETAGLRSGDRVHVEVEHGTVTIRRARPRYSLEELLVGMTPETMHREVEFGESVGSERFWESE